MQTKAHISHTFSRRVSEPPESAVHKYILKVPETGLKMSINVVYGLRRAPAVQKKNAPASAGTYRLVRKLPFYSYLHRILHRATIELDTDHVDALGESPDFSGQVRRSCRNISCKARHLVASHVKEIHLGIPRFAGNQRTICKIQVYSGSNVDAGTAEGEALLRLKGASYIYPIQEKRS